MRLALALATLASLLLGACRTGLPAGPRAGTAPAGRPPPARAALPGEDRISAAQALADATWLADPARGGRGTGTPGGAEAAAWIAARLEALGLSPAGPAGWHQPFEAPVGAKLAGENALTLGGKALALQVDFQPFTFSDDGVAEGELVFAGYGISAPALGYDDFAGLDVKGKVVLVAADFPGEADPASPFRDPKHYQYAEWRYKAMNARDHGAAALLAVRDDWNHPGPPGSDDLPAWKGQVSSRAGIAAARVTLAALRAAGVDAAALAKPIHEDRRPRSRALGVPVRLATGVAQERAGTGNVLGLLPGSDPAVAGECVVVGAHYDHLGRGGETSMAPGVAEVHPGADDNASGVAALLQIAGAFVAGGPHRRSVLFAAFAAEELGLLGSAQLVKALPEACPLPKLQLMVNLDMVGRPSRGKVYVDGADTARGLRAAVGGWAEWRPRVPLQVAFGGDGYGPSDHTSFYARGVPVLFLFTGAHGDYHRPSDTADKLDPEGLAAVARLAFRAARGAARGPRLEVVRAPPPPGLGGERPERRGYGAYLGAIPDFEERPEPGILLTGTRPGSPAEAAGLRAGDVLLELSGQKLVGLQDLAYALRARRPGDAVELVWRRGGVTLRGQVTLAERK